MVHAIYLSKGSFKKMFLGTNFVPLFLFEIALRTSIMYLYTIINIRLFRTRSIAQLTSFELIIVIALGSAVGDPMFYPEIPLINGMITITTIVILTKFISMVARSNDPFESIVVGQPIVLIKDGEILQDNVTHADISKEELNARLRYHGIKNTGEVAYAVLEVSGQLSVITAEHPKKGISTLNHFE